MTMDRIKNGRAAWLAISCLVIGCGPIDSLLGREPNPDCRKPECVPPDTSTTCASNTDCPSPDVCDVVGSKQCVQCTQDQAAACSGKTPACGADHMCRACVAHTDCAPSNACLPDGSCAAEADVAYVDPAGTDNVTCSKAMPCSTVKKALMTARSYVKFHGIIDETVTVNSKAAVTFLADPGATLTHASGAGVVLTVQSDVPALAIYDLAIANIGDVNATGISVPAGAMTEVSLTRVAITNNGGVGISIGGGSLSLTQSIVSHNGRGGVFLGEAKFAIVGNVFLGNGGLTSLRGALEISAVEADSNRLEFNSFYGNAARDGVGTAIQCSAGRFTARNNILFQNGTLTNLEQVSGSCSHTYSIAKPGSLPSGPANMAVDPQFKDPAHDDLHVQPGSPAIHAADPLSDLAGLAARDLDGTRRMRPATLGAYQMP